MSAGIPGAELELAGASSPSRTTATRRALGLAQLGTRLYLVCRFSSNDSERSLAPNRMVSASVTNLGFTKPLVFDLEKFDNDGRFGFGLGKKIKLQFLMETQTALHLLEFSLYTDQTATLEGEQYRIKVAW